MSEKDAKTRLSLAAPALALALFQCWYAYLPDADAVAFHHCRFNRHLDCYKSLSVHGSQLEALGVSALAALATLYLAMTLLLAGAALAEEPRRTGWRAWASILAFPAAGLSVFILLKDWMDASVTSLSTLLILGLGLALCVLAVLRGVSMPSLRATAGSFGGWLALAVAGGVLLQGTGSAQLVAGELELQRLGEPPQLQWARFAHAVPRGGAAHLGSPTAPREMLVFVDPAQEESRALMRAAAELAPTLREGVVIWFYAPDDPRLLAAHERGRLAAFLADPESTPDARPSAAFDRQQRGIARAEVKRLPLVWTADGKHRPPVDLRALVDGLVAR